MGGGLGDLSLKTSVKNVVLGIKRVISPDVVGATRLQSTCFEHTCVKDGYSIVGINIESPLIGRWFIKFKIEYGGQARSPKIVGEWVATDSGFEFKDNGKFDTFFDTEILEGPKEGFTVRPKRG